MYLYLSAEEYVLWQLPYQLPLSLNSSDVLFNSSGVVFNVSGVVFNVSDAVYDMNGIAFA